VTLTLRGLAPWKAHLAHHAAKPLAVRIFQQRRAEAEQGPRNWPMKADPLAILPSISIPCATPAERAP
jgi:hypothetical protein